jgi:hypothetical protein
MALSVFEDRKAPPTDAAIEEALGRSAAAWSRLKDELTGESALQEEWAFAGAKFGWSLRLKRGKRVIVYMTPCAGHFLASFVLGEKACVSASEAGLPATILAAIADAPKYAEGRGFRIPVRSLKEIPGLLRLAAIKLAH